MADGLFINPVVGWKKENDFDNLVILRAHEHLIQNYLPKNRIVLSVLSTPMRYAGPREAVFHAIVRRNFGCTHFIVGRDHAGVGNFYEPFEAHELLDNVGDLGIEIIKVREVFWCKKCGMMASSKSCGHTDEYRIYISMTEVRNMLMRGEIPPKEMVREDIARILMDDWNLSARYT